MEKIDQQAAIAELARRGLGPDGRPMAAGQRQAPVAQWPQGATALPNGTVGMMGPRGGWTNLGRQKQDFTEGASKAGEFASRMQGAEENIQRLAFRGKKTRTLGDVSMSTFGTGKEGTGSPLNRFRSAEDQLLEAAQREWLAALLRKDTGAAVTKEEFQLYGPMYLPMDGDKPEVLEQKRLARERAFKGSVATSEGHFETNFGRPYYPNELSGRSPLRRPGGPQYKPPTRQPAKGGDDLSRMTEAQLRALIARGQ